MGMVPTTPACEEAGHSHMARVNDPRTVGEILVQLGNALISGAKKKKK